MCVVLGVGVEVPAYMHVCDCFDDPQMGTADTEILRTQCFQVHSLLRNNVHLEYFMHLTSSNTCKASKRFRSVLVFLVMCVTSVDCC